MPSIGPTEIILIVLVLLLLFGGRKIPELMRGLGTGMKEFKKATSMDDDADSRRASDRKFDRTRDDRYLDERRDDRRFDEPRSERSEIDDERARDVRPTE